MANQIAQYWADDLPESHREALFDALCILTDDFLGDNEHNDSLIAYFLPQKYSLQYTAAVVNFRLGYAYVYVYF